MRVVEHVQASRSLHHTGLLALSPAPHPDVDTWVARRHDNITVAAEAQGTQRLVVTRKHVLSGVVTKLAQPNLAFRLSERCNDSARMHEPFELLNIALWQVLNRSCRRLFWHEAGAWGHSELTQATIIVRSVQAVDQSLVKEVEDVRFEVEHHYNDLLIDLNCLDLTIKCQLSDYLLLQVVPEHHLVGWPLRALTPAHQSQNIRLVDHLCNRYSTVKVSV